MSNMAQYTLPENVEKALRLLAEKTGDTPKDYVIMAVKMVIEGDLDALHDDFSMEKRPFYFSPLKHTWITWLSEVDGYETPEDFIVRCVRDRTDHIKTPLDKSLSKAEKEAGIPDLTPFKEQVQALLDME